MFIKKCMKLTKVSLALLLGVHFFLFPMNGYAGQSPNWYSDVNGVWYLRDSAGTGNVVNTWFEDLDGSWYRLAPDGSMYAGLIYDSITDSYYYLQVEHDGFYGRLASTNGLYTVNGQQIYLTFNQNHDGTFGKILSGLESLKGAGIQVTNINDTPAPTQTQPQTQQTPQETVAPSGPAQTEAVAPGPGQTQSQATQPQTQPETAPSTEAPQSTEAQPSTSDPTEASNSSNIYIGDDGMPHTVGWTGPVYEDPAYLKSLEDGLKQDLKENLPVGEDASGLGGIS